MNGLVLALIGLLMGVFTYVVYQAGKDKGQKESQESANWHSLVKGVTDPEVELAWLSTVRRMYDIFIRKNSDYGRTTGAMGGVKGIALRLGDKVGRLWTLTGLSAEAKQKRVQDEAIADTFLDVANYGIIGYLMAVEQWPRATVDVVIGKKAIASMILSALNDMDADTRDEVYAAFVTQEIAAEMDKATFQVLA